MMSDETTLLPCPFCMGEAETWDGAGPWHVVCVGCGTVGSPCLTKAEAIAAWNTRATHGTLTAEQVREAVESNSWAETSSIREFNDSSWKAIADELNAELGGDTCENIAPDYLDFLCNKCGFVHYHSDENDAGDGNDWNYCPNCGKQVSA